MYLLDTNILSFAGRGDRNVLTKLSQNWSNTFWCDISLAEFEYGYAKAATIDLSLANRIRESNEDITKNLSKVDVSTQVFELFGRLKFELKTNPIEDLDKLIAATALAYDLILVTDNTKHFERVEGLIIENWKLA